jgi:methionyl-tRNA formyltransferase
VPGAVVFGYGELGVTAIETLASLGEQVVAAVAPGNRAGHDVDRFTRAAAERDIPVWVQPPRRLLAPFLERLRAAAPDTLLVWSYSMLLPPAVLDVPRRGAVNVHSGLLPEYRGGHVVQWAILNGERETGATLHYLDAGIDTGPIIETSRFPIGDTDDAMTVRAQLKRAGERLLRQWWPAVVAGSAPRLPQDEARARLWPLRTVADGRIAWSMTTEQIDRMVRALRCNSPGAFVEVGGTVVSLRSVEKWREERPGCGAFMSVDGAGVVVGTSDGAILILAAESEGHTLTAPQIAALFGVS